MTEFQKDNLHYPAKSYDYDEVVGKVKIALEKIQDIVGPFHREDGPPEETYFTCALSDGKTLLGVQGGKPLFASRYKSRCSDRDHCPSFKLHCESPTESGIVSHFLLSSQAIAGENVWEEMKPGMIVGVDETMLYHEDEL